MNKIKTFKLFESNDEYQIKYDVNDLLMDIRDIGMICTYSMYRMGINYILNIKLNGKSRLYKFSDIKDEIYRIDDFLKSNGYNLIHGIVSEGKFGIRSNISSLPNYENKDQIIRSLNVTYKSNL